MRPRYDTDVGIAALAGRQHGVVSRAQLLHAGLSAEAVKRRLRAGRLHPLHRGVYAVGHRVLTVEGRWMAAVLACGPRAVLSHGSAAALWDLRRAGTAVHVSVPGRGGRKAPSGAVRVRLHRSPTLTAAAITSLRGIPVTTPARTIVDLARTMRGRPLEQIVDRADQRGLIDFGDLRQARPAALKAVLERYRAAPTRSELEERFLQLCDDHGIERPETNARIGGFEVDFVWREKKLIVEVDGYAYHRSPSQFERDRERDVHLQVSGWQVRRFTWRQITRRPAWVAAAARACAPAPPPASRTPPGRRHRRTGTGA